MYILLSGKLLNQDHVKTSHRFRNLMLTIMTLLISVEFQCFKCFKLFLGITTCGVIIDHEMLAVFHSFSFSYLFFLFCFGFCWFLFVFVLFFVCFRNVPLLDNHRLGLFSVTYYSCVIL